MVTEQANKEWTDILEEELSMVDAPSSYMEPGEILNKPTADAPLPLRVTDLKFKGYVEVWNTRTGVRKLQPRNLLWQTRTKTWPDGSSVFTFTDPKIPPNYGEDLFCPLNPLSPDYLKIKGMGFKNCRKQHIPHQDGVNNHVMHSHKRAWTALELNRTDRMREEDRQAQRELTKAIKLAVVQGVQPSKVAPVDSLETIIAPVNITQEEHSLEVELIERIQLSPNDEQWKEVLPHTHLYRGKKAGAACKIEGCLVVRSTDAKTRSKKA